MNETSEHSSDFGSTLDSTTGMKYCSDLNDGELLRLLATCAMDSYSFDARFTLCNLELMKHKTEEFGGGKGLQYAVYKVRRPGSHQNELIIAYRGTEAFASSMQDLDLFFGGNLEEIRLAIEFANNVAINNRANWVCGHSLGGLVAECVCSNTGLGGASFNAPGPWTNIRNNLVDPERYDGKPFEVHLTSNDPISLIGNHGGPDSSHIGKPRWHSHGGGNNMEALLRHIGTLKHC